MKFQIAVVSSVLFLSIFPVADAGTAAKPSNQLIIKQWNEANVFCRGSTEEDKETLAWCTVREAIAEVLSAREWCYGKQDEAEYQHKWHKCATDSIK
jgi:hypothetical protein